MLTMRKEVKWFAEQMESKLKENDYKGGWKNDDKEELTQLLLSEVAELMNTSNRKNIINESIDVANFAMMIADNARKDVDNE